jgi:hypothetical protein
MFFFSESETDLDLYIKPILIAGWSCYHTTYRCKYKLDFSSIKPLSDHRLTPLYLRQTPWHLHVAKAMFLHYDARVFVAKSTLRSVSLHQLDDFSYYVWWLTDRFTSWFRNLANYSTEKSNNLEHFLWYSAHSRWEITMLVSLIDPGIWRSEFLGVIIPLEKRIIITRKPSFLGVSWIPAYCQSKYIVEKPRLIIIDHHVELRVFH